MTTHTVYHSSVYTALHCFFRYFPTALVTHACQAEKRLRKTLLQRIAAFSDVNFGKVYIIEFLQFTFTMR